MSHPVGEYRFDDVAIELSVESGILSAGDDGDVAVRLTDTTGEWTVDRIGLDLYVHYRTEDGYARENVSQSSISDSLSTLTGLTELRRIPISVPHETPATIGSADVSAEITLDSPQATAEYEEFLTVGPLPEFQMVLQSMLGLGFSLENSECRAAGALDGPSFIQVLTFTPRAGPFAEAVDEVDLFVRTGERTVTVFLDDTPGGDRYTVPRSDESTAVLSDPDAEQTREEIAELLDRNLSA